MKLRRELAQLGPGSHVLPLPTIKSPEQRLAASASALVDWEQDQPTPTSDGAPLPKERDGTERGGQANLPRLAQGSKGATCRRGRWWLGGHRLLRVICVQTGWLGNHACPCKAKGSVQKDPFPERHELSAPPSSSETEHEVWVPGRNAMRHLGWLIS